MKKREPTQKDLHAKLLAWIGSRTQPDAADCIHTPLRTFKSWILRERPIRGLLRAYLELHDEVIILRERLKK